MLCLGGLDSVWRSLLLTWGGKRISADECDYRRSKQIDQGGPWPEPCDKGVAATENSEAAAI
jgi:hypothetical protein